MTVMVFVKYQIRWCKVIFGHTNMTKMPNKLSTTSFWHLNMRSFSQAHCMHVALFVHEFISPALLSTFWHFMLSFWQAHTIQLELLVKQLISSTQHCWTSNPSQVSYLWTSQACFRCVQWSMSVALSIRPDQHTVIWTNRMSSANYPQAQTPPQTWARRSEMMMNFFSTFLGRM